MGQSTYASPASARSSARSRSASTMANLRATYTHRRRPGNVDPPPPSPPSIVREDDAQRCEGEADAAVVEHNSIVWGGGKVRGLSKLSYFFVSFRLTRAAFSCNVMQRTPTHCPPERQQNTTHEEGGGEEQLGRMLQVVLVGRKATHFRVRKQPHGVAG